MKKKSQCDSTVDDVVQDGDTEWSQSIAELAADSLVTAGLVSDDQYSKAVDVIAEDIFVRLIVGDRPKGVSDNEK